MITYRWKFFTLTSYFFLTTICATAQSTVAFNDLSDPDSIFTKERSDLIYQKTRTLPDNATLAIALIKDGKEYFYGLTRHRDTISSIDNADHIFEIGSITKVFTCTLLAQLVLEGVLDLDDTINDYLPFELHDGIEISFRQLASHTSGLPRLPSNLDLSKVDPDNPYKNYGEDELIHYLTHEMELQHKPGTVHEYSNLGVGLLGYILTKITDQKYEQLIQLRFFNLYKMNHSTTNRKKINQPLVKGINDQGETVPNWDMNVLTGAGGVLSSVRDLSKFVKAHFNTNDSALVLTREVVFQISAKRFQGLGWMILSSDNQSAWYWHNGGTGGYTSSMIIDVGEKNGIIVLSNISAFSKVHGTIDELSYELMSSLSKTSSD